MLPPKTIGTPALLAARTPISGPFSGFNLASQVTYPANHTLNEYDIAFMHHAKQHTVSSTVSNFEGKDNDTRYARSPAMVTGSALEVSTR